MERHELPTHLHVDDKLIAGLTVRQVLFLSVGVSVGYSLWLHLAWLTQVSPLARSVALAALVRLALATLPVIGMAACILIRPGDRPLEDWLPVALRYAVLPKVAVWQTTYAGRDAEIVRHFLMPASQAAGQPGDAVDEDDAYWFDLRTDSGAEDTAYRRHEDWTGYHARSVETASRSDPRALPVANSSRMSAEGGAE